MCGMAQFHHLACVISHTPSIRPRNGPAQRPWTVGSAPCAPPGPVRPCVAARRKKPTEPMRHRSNRIEAGNARTVCALALLAPSRRALDARPRTAYTQGMPWPAHAAVAPSSPAGAGQGVDVTPDPWSPDEDAWADEDEDAAWAEAWAIIDAHGPRSADAVAAWLAVAREVRALPERWALVWGPGCAARAEALGRALRCPTTSAAAQEARRALRDAVRGLGVTLAGGQEQGPAPGVVELRRYAPGPAPAPRPAPAPLAVRGPRDRRVSAW